MADVSSVLSLGDVTVSAAGTQILDWVDGLNGLAGLSGFIRFAGTGGTSVDVYVQTSPDGGGTIMDLACAHFTAAGLWIFSLAQGACSGLVVTDGALAANTALNSGVVPLFDRYRIKVVSVGAWSSGLVTARAMPRG
jgi:hypothetical protein